MSYTRTDNFVPSGTTYLSGFSAGEDDAVGDFSDDEADGAEPLVPEEELLPEDEFSDELDEKDGMDDGDE